VLCCGGDGALLYSTVKKLLYCTVSIIGTHCPCLKGFLSASVAAMSSMYLPTAREHGCLVHPTEIDMSFSSKITITNKEDRTITCRVQLGAAAETIQASATEVRLSQGESQDVDFAWRDPHYLAQEQARMREAGLCQIPVHQFKVRHTDEAGAVQQSATISTFIRSEAEETTLKQGHQSTNISTVGMDDFWFGMHCNLCNNRKPVNEFPSALLIAQEIRKLNGGHVCCLRVRHLPILHRLCFSSKRTHRMIAYPFNTPCRRSAA
jgi:hypothetical protein